MENLVSNITNIIFGGMSNFANGIGNAFSNFAQNIFLSTSYTLEYTNTPVLVGSIIEGAIGNPPSFQYDVNFDLNTLFNYDYVKEEIYSFFDGIDNTIVTFSGTSIVQEDQRLGESFRSIPIELFSYDGSMNNSINDFVVSLFDGNVTVDVVPRAHKSVNVYFPMSSNEIVVGDLYLNKFDSIPSYSLNTFGFVTIAFTSLALMFGLSRWVLNIITSLGKRNK